MRPKHARDANLGFTGPITVTKKDGNNWETYSGLRYEASEETFDIAAGSGTDFISQPRILAWIAPRSGATVPGGVLHDHLWREEAPKGRISYRDADAIFRQALRVSDVPFVIRWLCWTAVRWGALTRRGGTRGWWRDAPLVLLWTLIAVPLVAGPVVAVGASLVFLQILEWVFWLLLYPFSRKTVNPPKVTIKT